MKVIIAGTNDAEEEGVDGEIAGRHPHCATAAAIALEDRVSDEGYKGLQGEGNESENATYTVSFVKGTVWH